VDKILYKENKTNFHKLDDILRIKIKEKFNSFFKFLNNDFETEIFYKKKSKILLNEISKIFFDDGTEIYFLYGNLNFKRREVKNKKLGIRVSYDMSAKCSAVNKSKTNSSLRANLIHATDSNFARKIILKFHCLTIHDCFCIRLAHIIPCLDYANEIFRNDIVCDDNVKDL
jgi:hypothetical protein